MPPPHLYLGRSTPDTEQNAAGPPAPGPEPWRLPVRRVYPTALTARLWPRPGCPGRLAAGLWLPAAVGTRYLSPNQAHGPPASPSGWRTLCPRRGSHLHRPPLAGRAQFQLWCRDLSARVPSRLFLWPSTPALVGLKYRPNNYCGCVSQIPSDAPSKTVSALRSEEHTSELQSRGHLVCRLLLEKKNKNDRNQQE